MYPVSSEEALSQLPMLCRRLRSDILKMIAQAGSGHPGGSLSAIDMIATLYLCFLRHDARQPDWPLRDRFVLSKGHGVPALYAVLAECGYFDKALLPTLRTLGSPLQGHPVRGTIAGVEACTGSLGQGLSVAVGMALSAKLDGHDSRIVCMMGDGEIQEGQVWEAAMSAAKFGLDNLIGIVDCNKGQIDGPVAQVMPLEPLEEKWRSFGWSVRRIDGHNYLDILDALRACAKSQGRPAMLIADTVKGKGVSFMESDVVGWHGVAPNQEQLKQALLELEGKG